MGSRSPIYLDNNSTTPLDPRVLEAMLPSLKTDFGNPSSTTHAYGWHAAELIKIAREQVAALIGAEPDEIVFTSGATESINLLLFGWAGSSSKTVRHYISSEIEHRAVLDPLQVLQGRARSEVTLLPVDSEGMLSAEAVLLASRGDPELVSLMLGNNEIGSIFPIGEIGAGLRSRGILFHCDASQAAGKISIDVNRLSADFLSFSAHKIYGPKGVGALFIRRGLKESIAPLIFGGGQESGLRAGTLNVSGIVGFGRAAEIAKTELQTEARRLQTFSDRFLSEISARVQGIALNGPAKNRLPGNLSLRISGIDNARLIGLIQHKLAVSTSSACQSASKTPSHVLQALKLSGEAQRASIRIGFGRFNTEEELTSAVNALAEGIEKARN